MTEDMEKEEKEEKSLEELEQEAIEATGGCLAASRKWLEEMKKRNGKDKDTGKG